MRGRDRQRGHLGGYVNPEARVPQDHPLRQIRPLVDAARQPGEEGWMTLQLAFESFEVARSRVLSLGAGVEVLAPDELQSGIAQSVAELARMYLQGR